MDLGEGPAPQALSRLIGSSWQILNQHRQLMQAGLHTSARPGMRAHHDHAMKRVEQLIARGQTDHDIRADQQRLRGGWQVGYGPDLATGRPRRPRFG